MLTDAQVKEEKAKENLDPNNGPVQIVTEIPHTIPGCDHFFQLKSGPMGLEIQCQRCQAGFIASPGSDVRDGHIYLAGKLIL